MTSLIAVHRDFDTTWPFTADHWRHRWEAEGPTTFIRADQDGAQDGAQGNQQSVGELIAEGSGITRLAALGVPVTPACLEKLPDLREAAIMRPYGQSVSPEVEPILAARGIQLYRHHSEGFWGESVAECALALTLCALRGIPQQYRAMIDDHEVWEHYSSKRSLGAGHRGAQFSDDIHFTNGTIAGKRVRVVGTGNIGSRYAGFASMMGADVAAWDPVAPDPSFHRAGARKVWRLDELVSDAEIFVPMMPLLDKTRGIVTAEHIRALPTGCLVVLITRAGIVDMPEVRRRVLANELALAADVFDIEPLPLNDPLLGHPNVVHTPHIAGRTRDANHEWADMLIAQFRHSA